MRYFLTLLLSINYTAWLWASDAQLENVTIQGQSVEAFSPFDFSGNHQRLESKDFSKKFTLLPDLLEQQSGIEIHSIGGIGQYASPSIRGSASQQVLVFWDGLLINSLNGGGANLSNLNLSAANHIDIYRGLAPIELSASAIGGVIHLQSKNLTQTSRNEGQACATLGSYGLQQYCLSQQVSSANNQFFISAEWLQADNDFKYLETHPVSNPNQPQYEKRYNNGAQQAHILVKNSRQFEALRVDAAVQASQSEQQLSAKINFPQNDTHLDSKQYNAQVRLQKEWSSLASTEVIGQIQKHIQLYDDRQSRVGLGAQWDEYSTESYKLQLNQYVFLNDFNLTGTLRLHDESTDTDFKLLSQAEVDQQCRNGVRCETRYQRQQFDAGLRGQYWFNDTSLTGQFSHIQVDDKNLDFLNNKNQQQANTWYLTLQHNFNSSVSAYINLSEQVRLPATHELFGDRGTSKGNADLLPEKAQGYEAGFSIDGNSWQLKSSLYWRDLEDAIIAETDSRGVIHFSNLAKTQHLGFEQSAQWQTTDKLSVSANFTVQSNEIIKHTNTPAYQGNQAAGFSPLHTFLSATWREDFWDFSLSHNYLYGGFYTNSNSIDKDTENRLDADLGFFAQQWRVSLSVTDITNSAARDFPSYPEPGRMYFMRLNYQW